MALAAVPLYADEETADTDANSGSAVQSEEPSRVINLVYDDSGSMIQLGDGTYVDTWCQAKYAMEVFAAMLGDKDTMKVYYMSAFDNGTDGKPGLTLKGSDGAAANVRKVHKKVTQYGNTPFDAVRAAESDLEKADADQKWLVVLTDGAFEDGAMKQSEIDAFFAAKPSDVQVMYLAMGSEAVKITENETDGIYFESASDSSEILSKLTGISQRIFNLVDLSVKEDKISFDVPMKELIVFAQGKDVTIHGLQTPGGDLIESDEDPVNVQYSEKATQSGFNSDEIRKTVDKSLKGSISSFGDVSEGEYTLDADGAKTISVYYKPDVAIDASLLDSSGKEVTKDHLSAGKYTIQFDIVKDGTEESVKDSDLLVRDGKDIEYEAVVNNNGNEQTVGDGGQVTIEEGTLNIDAAAHYLKQYTVNTSMSYTVYKDKEVTFTISEDPGHDLTGDGFDANAAPTEVTATLDGKKPTSAQWAQMDVPEVKTKSEDPKVEYTVEKSDTPGMYHLWPKTPDKLAHKTYTDSTVQLNYSSKTGDEVWKGSSSVTVRIHDERSWLNQHLALLIKLGFLGILAIILLGYTPWFKHRLPKRLSKTPTIRSRPVNGYGSKRQTFNGSFVKEPMTKYLPYVAEKGTIRYIPKGVSGPPKLQVRGAKGGRMEITNISVFKKKKNAYTVKVDDMTPADLTELGDKPFITSANLTMAAEINNIRYTCTMSE